MSGNRSLRGSTRGTVGRFAAVGVAMAVVVSIASSVPALARRPLADAGSRRLAAGMQAKDARASTLRLAGALQTEAPLAAVTIDLCAKAGTVDLPGLSGLPIWGFALKPGDAPCSDSSVAPELPGPTLDVNEGDLVTIVLHNEVPGQNVSMLLTGQDLFPDEEGIATGGSKSYTFTADDPGTYLYESGANSSRTVPMGLYGPLIVRAGTSNQAYDDPETAYEAEAVLVLSEVDPALNANPLTFNLVDYAPKYWLINGKAYPDSSSLPIKPVSIGARSRLLLRYLNAGLQHHTMALLGAHQRVIAKDAYLTPFPYDVVGETIPTGGTADMIATIPSTAGPGDRFPIFSRQLHLANDFSVPGGMLTFVDIVNPTEDNQAPAVAASPDKTITPITLPASGSLSGTVTDDGLPSDTVTTTWTEQSGPGTISFGDSSAVTTTAIFSVPGNYLLRLTASDGELSSFDEITITVRSPTIHVGDLDRRSLRISKARWRARVRVSVHDARHAALAGVTVRGRWSAGDKRGRTMSCVTNGAGTCTLQSGRLSRSSNPRVKFTVTNLILAPYVYRSRLNHDPDGESTGTAILVRRR
jgi:FtsP/CotA-like multicopper oxidase with cupredoxin domain